MFVAVCEFLLLLLHRPVGISLNAFNSMLGMMTSNDGDDDGDDGGDDDGGDDGDDGNDDGDDGDDALEVTFQISNEMRMTKISTTLKMA